MKIKSPTIRETLETLLGMARLYSTKILTEGDDEFMKSNMPLQGHLFLKLTSTGIFKKTFNKCTDEGKEMLTRGAREIARTMSEQVFETYQFSNDYEMRVISALAKCALYDFQVAQALGASVHCASSANATLNCLEAKGRVRRRDDYKYELVCDEGATAFD